MLGTQASSACRYWGADESYDSKFDVDNGNRSSEQLVWITGFPEQSIEGLNEK